MGSAHLALFSESVGNAAFANIDARPDSLLGVNAAQDDLLLAEKLLFAAMLYAGGGSQMLRARLTNSYLEKTDGAIRPYIVPVDTAATPGDLPPIHDYRANPLMLWDTSSKVQGRLNAQVVNTGAAQRARVLALLSDGPVKAADMRGAIPIRWSGALTTTVAEEFQPVTALAFDETLPLGTYDLLHARVQGATAYAWNIIPPSGLGNDRFRPGWLAVTDTLKKESIQLGGLGKLCTFRSDAPPTVQIAANTAAVQSPEGVFYVRRVGA